VVENIDKYEKQLTTRIIKVQFLARKTETLTGAATDQKINFTPRNVPFSPFGNITKLDDVGVVLFTDGNLSVFYFTCIVSLYWNTRSFQSNPSAGDAIERG
jgi:hypothetical protein